MQHKRSIMELPFCPRSICEQQQAQNLNPDRKIHIHGHVNRFFFSPQTMTQTETELVAGGARGDIKVISPSLYVAVAVHEHSN